MSVYQDVVLSQSPSYFFKADETAWPVVNSGSATITGLTQEKSWSFDQPNGIQGTSCWVNTSYDKSWFSHTDTTAIFNDGVFSISMWLYFGASMPVGNFTIFDASGNNQGLYITAVKGSNGSTGIEVRWRGGLTEQYGLGLNTDSWKHLAFTFNGGTIKFYLNGVAFKSLTGATVVNSGDTNTKYWLGSKTGNTFIGKADEIAVFNTALSDQDITDQYQAAVGAKYTASAVTASALMVQPALSLSKALAADPATASSLMGNTQVSNFDPSTTLNTYLSSLNLENYYKLNTLPPVNSGTAGNSNWVYIGDQKVYESGGPAGSPYLNTNYIANNFGGPASEPLWTNALSSDEFTVALWFRRTASGPFDLIKFFKELYYGLDIEAPLSNMAVYLGIDSSGYLKGYAQTGSGSQTLTGSTNLLDGQWHMVGLSYSDSANTLSLYQDGNYIATGELTGSTDPIVRVFLGYQADLSALIIDDNTTLNETALDTAYGHGTRFFQAAAFMPQDIKVKISTAFYDYLGSNAVTEFKFDGPGIPVDTGTAGIEWGGPVPGASGSNILAQQSAKNVYSYKFTNKESFYTTISAATDFSDDQITVVTLFKVNPTLMQDETESYYGVRNIIYQPPLHAMGGMTLGVGADNYFAYIAPGDYSQEVFVQTDSLTLDSNWHLLGFTKNGTALKLYLDGKLVKSETLSTNIPLANGLGYGFVGGNEVGWFYATPGATEKYIDYAGAFDTAFTTEQMFEMYQALAQDRMDASAMFPTPVGVTGFGPNINPGVMYVSALLVDPTQQDTVAPTILPATAFAALPMPNYEATVLIEADYSASAMTASALFHMPQYQIGEINSVDNMAASAEMGNHRFTTPGLVPGNPFVATNATLPMPELITIKGARVEAPSLNARAFFALPPAYTQLTDDPYFVRLYGVHSQKTIEAAQSFSGAGIATAATTSVAKSFLKFFNDVNADITLGSTNYLTNEMPNYVYDPIGTIYTDANGNIVPPDSTKRQISSRSGRGSIAPTPILSKGYFDAWDRKAVNLTNIEFNFGTDSQYHSLRGYSVEFTIKTTKSNQVLTYGEWQSFYYNQRAIGTIGLFDGKLYSMRSFQPIGGSAVIPHPTNIDELTRKQLENGYMAGNKRIDDGQWHHIVIQFGFIDNRTQYWIDGELDRQLIDKGSAPGANGYCDIRPYTLGFNNDNIKLASDFQTSVWSWTPNKFLEERDIKLNYEAAYKYNPIFAEPMLASVSPTQDHKAEGNRGRALMLYWWPTNTDQRRGGYLPTFNQSGLPFDGETFDPELDTVDYATAGPQEYEGWDIFPVDVTGYFVSDLVKVEAYGGVENIRYGNGGGHILTQAGFGPEWKFNARQTFRNSITDAPRYLDLVNDIDLSQFDAIMFKNFPDQTNEIEAYANQEVVDAYFGIRELKIYEDFIKSLRAAVDSGISLYVTNTELAIDLGIIDRVEVVPDMDEDVVSGFSDPYAPTQVPEEAADLPISTGDTINRWRDTYKNNRLRLVNTVQGMTEFPTVIRTQVAAWVNDDQIRWAGADRVFTRLEIKPNGLSVGDEWIISRFSASDGPTNYQAVPFANIKAGKPVTAFANQVRRGLDLIDNPYKNHATSIVVEKGDRLNGSICGGKIFVNFTELLADDAEDFGVDLIQNQWINYAEAEEIITPEYAAILRASGSNIDNQNLPTARYNELAYWSSNGMYVLQQNVAIPEDADPSRGGGIVKPKSQRVRKINKNGGISFQSVSKGGQWFSAEYSWQYPRVSLDVPSMLTRGFWWVSNRELPTGTVVGAPVMTASVTFVEAAATPDKIINISSNAMIANARIIEGDGYAPNDASYPSLPMTANALMNDKIFKIDAAPILVSANMPQNTRALTSSIDEVIVYIMHEDAILYLREEVIK